MAARDAHEFVRVDDHPIIEDNLIQSSEQLKHSIDAAFEASAMHSEKHEKIVEAKRIVIELLDKIHELNKMMMREKFEDALKRSAPKAVIYREAKRKFTIKREIPQENKETLERSEKALQNLHKNLEVLKKQFY